MIGTLTKALKKVFGDKAQRDLKEVMPLVERCKEEYGKLQGLSHDELRTRTAQFKARIAERTKDSNDKVDALRAEIDAAEAPGNESSRDRSEQVGTDRNQKPRVERGKHPWI